MQGSLPSTAFSQQQVMFRSNYVCRATTSGHRYRNPVIVRSSRNPSPRGPIWLSFGKCVVKIGNSVAAIQCLAVFSAVQLSVVVENGDDFSTDWAAWWSHGRAWFALPTREKVLIPALVRF